MKTLSELLKSKTFTRMSGLPLALGMIASHRELVVDLTTLPHLLIAGSTGSGKSVCLHNIIISLLLGKEKVDLLLIDPKRVELAAYDGLRNVTHVYEQADIISRLTDAIWQMDKRYELIKRTKSRTIERHNSKVAYSRRIPRLVIIIDEFAMCVLNEGGREIELAMAKLAQMGRGCGIHLVIATQNPMATVVNSLIKINFPSRIAFRVPTKNNSRVILDSKGAETLRKPGDMIFMFETHLIRAKGVYTNEVDVEYYIDITKRKTGQKLNGKLRGVRR